MGQSRKVWLEVSLNGAHSKAVQPNGPHDVSKIVEEGLACAEAGASILHFHAFEGDTDTQVYDAETYGRILEGFRKHSDAIGYGTVPMIGGFAGAPLMSPGERYRATEELLASGLMEWFVVDAGLVNFASYAGIAAGQTTAGMYLNPVDYISHAMDLAAQYNCHPTCGVWEPGFLRTAAAMAKAKGLRPSVLYKFDFTETMPFGLPPEPYALNCYARLAAQFAPGAPWMVAGVGADVFPLIPEALALGGHVRVGLEDALPNSPATNLELVRRAAKLVEDAGLELQTPAGIRAELAGA
ncbi:3-keto-5-aminohexanoate cleavage protein [Ruegeria pomeroyi]|nr:3-keto-5-aminohexanoate cleavage protein [Ruegeria pomeroyi]